MGAEGSGDGRALLRGIYNISNQYIYYIYYHLYSYIPRGNNVSRTRPPTVVTRPLTPSAVAESISARQRETETSTRI